MLELLRVSELLDLRPLYMKALSESDARSLPYVDRFISVRPRLTSQIATLVFAGRLE